MIHYWLLGLAIVLLFLFFVLALIVAGRQAMTPAQVNTAMMIIVPALCLISLCATVFVWALCRLAAPESVEVNEDTL
jgi:hypothetical protein